MIPGRKAAEQARPCRGEGMLFRVSPCGMFLRFTKRRPSVCAGRWLPLRRAQVVRLRPHPPGFDPAFPPAPGYSAALWRPMSFAVVPPLAPGYPPNPCRCRARRGGGAPPRPFLPESGYPPPSLPAPILFFLRFPPLPPLRPPLRRRAEGERGRAAPGPGGGGARRGRSFFFPAGRHERCAWPPCREGGVRLG